MELIVGRSDKTGARFWVKAAPDNFGRSQTGVVEFNLEKPRIPGRSDVS